MRGRLKNLGLFLFIAMPLAWGFPASGQQASVPTPPKNDVPVAEAPGEGNDECPERQDIREERERIRADYEALDIEHDRLKTQCMDSKGQQRAECSELWEQFKTRKAALHERRQALKEKIDADPGCHSHHKDGQKNSWPSHEESSASTPAAAPSAAATSR
jgi:hypothetical protein